MKSLKDIGFSYSGKFYLESGELNYNINCDVEHFIYVFAHDNKIMYIGKSQRTLDFVLNNRFIKGNPHQKTVYRIHNEIINSLKNLKPISIYTISSHNNNKSNLIKNLQPEWNINNK